MDDSSIKRDWPSKSRNSPRDPFHLDGTLTASPRRWVELPRSLWRSSDVWSSSGLVLRCGMAIRVSRLNATPSDILVVLTQPDELTEAACLSVFAPTAFAGPPRHQRRR